MPTKMLRVLRFVGDWIILSILGGTIIYLIGALIVAAVLTMLGYKP